jgi:uncharacterized protein YdeI (YjbR/CyaY-like superfamily)
VFVKTGENSQTQRQIRFTNVQEVVEMEDTLKHFIYEAIEIEKAGLEVNFKKTEEYTIPEELQIKFGEAPDLKAAFDALTPRRQRGYILYFSKAKQTSTRISRIEKYMPKILNGEGLND